MRVAQLFEMSQIDAVKIFRALGVDPSGLNPVKLRQAYLGLVMKHHPDRGGNVETAKLLNAAYDVIKHGVSTLSRDDGHGAASMYRRPEKQEVPVWAWAGHSGGTPPSASIHQDSYKDQNYIKKRMWELSGQSNEEWTLWGYDGHFIRNSLTVYGSPSIFNEMARAMYDWQVKGGNPYPCRAVFASRRSNERTRGAGEGELFLIYADGIFYGDNPVKFKHNSFNANPGNDQTFLRWLPEKLAELKQKRAS